MSALGAAWRIVDGMGVGPTHLRSLVLLGITMVALWPLQCPLWLIMFTGVSIVFALHRGFAGWEHFNIRQITQYWYAALPFPLLWYFCNTSVETLIIYGACLVIAGLAHPVLVRTNLPHQTRWAEAVCGAFVVGPLGVL